MNNIVANSALAPWLPWLYPLLGALVLCVLLYFIVVAALRRRTQRIIERNLGAIAYEVLKDVMVPTGIDEYLQVHYLLLTERGLLVIDVLDIPGSIFGGDQMIQWTSIGRKHRFTFPNPQHALYDRVAAVKTLVGETPVEGRLVFTLRGEFPKGRPRGVLRINELGHEFPLVNRLHGNIVAAFEQVWQRLRQQAGLQKA